MKKAIYDLKQSSRVWFEKFSEIIMGVGFHRCIVDHSVFIRKTKEGCVLAVYVDDILITGSNIAGIVET